MDNLALATEILSHRDLEIAGIDVNLVHLIQFSPVHSFPEPSHDDIDWSEEDWDFLIVELSLIEQVSGNRVRVVDFPSSFSRIADRRETIITEYDRVIFSEESRMKHNSPFEVQLTHELPETGLPRDRSH